MAKQITELSQELNRVTEHKDKLEKIVLAIEEKVQILNDSGVISSWKPSWVRS